MNKYLVYDFDYVSNHPKKMYLDLHDSSSLGMQEGPFGDSANLIE